MASKAKRHIHKYYRAELSFGDVWACALPDCTHYMPQHMEGLMNGKYSVCWECNERMVMHPGNLNMSRPVCDTCKLGVRDIDSVLAKRA